jgi:serine/threonine protein kinase
MMLASVDDATSSATDQAPPELLAHYALGELLGRGASASVYVAVDRESGQLAACKLLRRRNGNGSRTPHGANRDRSAALASEVAACQRLQSARHAARLHAVYESDASVAIVSELLPGGDLSDLLAHAPEGRLSEREAALAIRAALEFVADAHSLGYLVGDVKPQNFALRRLYPCARHLADPVAHPDKGVLDVAAIDFGCCVDVREAGAVRAAAAVAAGDGGVINGIAAASSSVVAAAAAKVAAAAARTISRSPSSSASSSMDDELCVVLPSMLPPSPAPTSPPSSSPSPSPIATTTSSSSSSSPSPLISGTPIYMAPEVLRGCASPSSDVWACGVMLYELLTGAFPFWRETAADVASLGARAVTEAINHGPVLFPRDPFATGHVRPEAQDLLLGMLRRDASRRLTARQALEHPWLVEVLGGGGGSAESS